MSPPVATPRSRAGAVWALAAAAFCLTVALASAGQIQAGYHSPHARPRQAVAVRQDSPGAELLKRMLGPKPDYTGEQVTERGGRVSRQIVRGSDGRIRLDYTQPPELSGDVMLIFPHTFRNYHHKTNTVDIALWPHGAGGMSQETHILRQLHENKIVAEQVGTEIVAGREAAIVQVTSAAASGRPAMQARFWIDPATGIKLKQENSGTRGLIWRSYFTSITIGPAAGVKPKDFDPAIMQRAHPNIIIPHNALRFDTVAEARSQFAFTPLAPMATPKGFQISKIWILPGGKHPESGGRAGIVLRYSDGITQFSLFEHPVVAGRDNHPPHAPNYRRSFQRWRVATASGELDVIYIGSLAPEEVATIRGSLRPIL